MNSISCDDDDSSLLAVWMEALLLKRYSNYSLENLLKYCSDYIWEFTLIIILVNEEAGVLMDVHT